MNMCSDETPDIDLRCTAFDNARYVSTMVIEFLYKNNIPVGKLFRINKQDHQVFRVMESVKDKSNQYRITAEEVL